MLPMRRSNNIDEMLPGKSSIFIFLVSGGQCRLTYSLLFPDLHGSSHSSQRSRLLHKRKSRVYETVPWLSSETITCRPHTEGIGTSETRSSCQNHDPLTFLV